MTTNDIRGGMGLNYAIQKEYGKMMNSLLKALAYCGNEEIKARSLSEKGRAGAQRLREICDNGKTISIMVPNKPEESVCTLSAMLLTIWAGMFYYPEISKQRYLVYAESIILLNDLLENGWVE